MNENINYDILRTTVAEWLEERNCNAGEQNLETWPENTSYILWEESVKLLTGADYGFSGVIPPFFQRIYILHNL